MKLTIKQWPIGRLRAYENNPRKNDHAVDLMVKNIEAFGFRIPIIAKSDGLIVDGHLRAKAAAKMGLAEVPVALADDMTDAQIKAFRIAVNQSANWAEWDPALLQFELKELQALSFDLGVIGFPALELKNIMADRTEGLTDPDDAPEPPAEPVTRLGDVWLLGGHRLACGDSTDAATVAKALNGAKPHLMCTDPPYGVSYDPSWRDGVDLNLGKKLGQKGTGRALGVVGNDDRADWREAWVLFPGDVAYVWHGALHAGTVEASLLAAGFAVRSQIIWAKQLQVFSRGDYHWKHEPCWYAVRRGCRGHWAADRKQTTLWEIQNNNPLGGGGEAKTGHSTQKPVECMRRPIDNNSHAGDAVYDPFSGSFTTGIAAEMTGRKAIAIEISPAYVDVGIIRWQNFTGKSATLEATGQSFEEVKADRLQVSLVPMD